MKREFSRTRFRVMDVVVLLAAGLLLVQAPASVAAAAWVPDLELLPRLALGGLLAGYLIERTRVPSPLGLLLAMLVGIEAITYVFAKSTVGGSIAEQVDGLEGHLSAWLDIVANGGISSDPLVFALAVAGLAWLLGVATAWLVFRDNAAWLAIVFNGIALLMNLSYASTSLVGYVGWFAFAACLLLAAQQLSTRTELWRRSSLKVSWRVVLNVLIGTALAVGALLSVAWALPSNVSNTEVAGQWARLTMPWEGLEGEFDRWFASLNGSENNARGLNFGRTLAPRGAFDLADTPVLSVAASAPLYLRATTADRYAGQAISSSETSTTQFEPNTDLLSQDAIPEERALLQAQITVLASRTSIAFAPDAPVRFSQAVQLDTRGDPNDVATVRLGAPVVQKQQYTVVSAVSTATVQELRAAGEDYPDWLRRRYLQLPRSVPRRVIDMAHDATTGATSGFDKAVALETYLRNNFTYSTHIGTVPPDRDWIDYFLFDTREGYCDYFATAMVVMLRAEGVPARVASGFAPGDFDAETGTSLVRENHAHSWVEAYFPLYGWITFEPSSIRSIPPRLEAAPVPAPAASSPYPAPDASGLTPDELNELRNMGAGAGPAPSGPFLTTWPGLLLLVGGALVMLALVGVGGVAILWRRGLGSLSPYQQPYAQLVKLGRWSGSLRARVSDTPFEIAERLSRQVPRAQPAIDELTAVYVEGTYSNRPPTLDPWPTWRSARRGVLRGLFGRRFGGWFGEDTSVSLAPRSHPELLREWGAPQRGVPETRVAAPKSERWWLKVGRRPKRKPD